MKQKYFAKIVYGKPVILDADGRTILAVCPSMEIAEALCTSLNENAHEN